MPGNNIPESDTIARHCLGRFLGPDSRPSSEAFALSERDLQTKPPFLSTNWLEYFAGIDPRMTRVDQINLVREAMVRLHLSKTSSKIILLNVASIYIAVRKEHPGVEIRHTPTSDNESHAGIYGMEENSGDIALRLSQVPCEVIPSRSEVT